jgi:EmrB/QacA subfamily drug resistance transporter
MTAKKAGPWVLAAMIFAVGMTFIDMTIVSIAIPEIQSGLQLSETGMQWVVNGYLLALAASFALGGRLGDTFGKRRMVTLGVIIFAGASALCSLTPEGSLAEAWIIAFRVVQGIGAALMIPAALALVVASYSVDKRGKALAIFFGITGALTAVGPIAGGYLVQIDWRAIFWINIPIAIIALVLIFIAKPDNDPAPAPIDYRGAALITGGIGLSVLGFQQSSDWGWGDPKTIGSLIIGTLLIIAFVRHELSTADPLMRVKIFSNKAFAADNVVLFLLMIVFIPLFFFASTYAQLVLGQSASEAGLYIMYFFIGFAVSTQIGGRILDKIGPRPTIIVGSIIGAIGFYLWASKMTDFSVNDQIWSIIIAGFGMGLILGPANTDAINRAPAESYAEATGITQTVRNYGAALGMAILGTILITQNRVNIEDNLGQIGIPKAQADQIASAVASGAQNAGTTGGAQAAEIFKGIQTSYAQSTQTIFYVMSGVLALIFIYSLIFVPRGKVDEIVADGTYDTDADSAASS